MSVLGADSDLVETIYEREIAAGKPEPFARAFAEAYVASYVESFSEGLATGYAEGSALERRRLRDLARASAVHGTEAQRWLLARELDPENVERWLSDADPDDSTMIDDGAAPPSPSPCH